MSEAFEAVEGFGGGTERVAHFFLITSLMALLVSQFQALSLMGAFLWLLSQPKILFIHAAFALLGSGYDYLKPAIALSIVATIIVWAG